MILILQKTGTLPFFSVKESIKTSENFSRMTGIASFNKDVLRHTIKNKLPTGSIVDDYIEENLIPALSFDEFARTQKIGKIDLPHETVDLPGLYPYPDFPPVRPNRNPFGQAPEKPARQHIYRRS